MSAICLAFDTALPHCDVALLDGDTVLARARECMERGQAERLMPLIGEVLADAGVGLPDLDVIAVGSGPGNFTGLRVAISTARGLRLGLGLPAFGVSQFDVIHARYPSSGGVDLISLPGPRGGAYVCAYRDGGPVSAPELVDPKAPRLPANGMTVSRVIGYNSADLAAHFGAEACEAELQDVAVWIGRLGGQRQAAGDDGSTRPSPIYVRPPDAAPPRATAPALLS